MAKRRKGELSSIMECHSRCVDIELRIQPRTDAGYPVELRVIGGEEYPSGLLMPSIVDRCRGLSDLDAGVCLMDALFAHDDLRAAWHGLRGKYGVCRIHFRIDTGAVELQALPWEMMPEAGPTGSVHLVATNHATPFSRYVAGSWPRPAPLPQPRLRVLVLNGAPRNLEAYGLAPLSAAVMTQQLRCALAPQKFDITFVPERNQLDALAMLGEEDFHILHIVAHGVQLTQGEGVLLADENGLTRAVSHGDLLNALSNWRTDRHLHPNAWADHARVGHRDERDDALPFGLRLLVLSSCFSAGTADRMAPTTQAGGLAMQLAAAGVPAVLAMRGATEQTLASDFMATVYQGLAAHGFVNLAVNQARARLRLHRPDAVSTPVLFSRLPSGRLWLPPSAPTAKIEIEPVAACPCGLDARQSPVSTNRFP